MMNGQLHLVSFIHYSYNLCNKLEFLYLDSNSGQGSSEPTTNLTLQTMKKLTTILIFLVSTNLFAQHAPKWELGLTASQDYLPSELFIAADGNIDGYSISYDSPSFSIGISTSHYLNDQIAVNSGLLFTNKDAYKVINCYTCDVNSDVIPFKMKQQYLSIPISVSYGFFNSKLRPHFNIGVVNNFNVVNEIENSKAYFLEGVAGLSMSYQFSDKIRAFLGYNYRMSLTSLYQDISAKDSKLTTHSLSIGFKYILK